jgi:outer membrane receptor protein involved in Fe transport
MEKRHINFGFTLSLLAVLLTISLLSLPANAQLTRGSIAGTVADNNGAVVAGAKVTITNVATNISRVATTNEVGLYRVPALEPGIYTVKIEKDGFETIEAKDVTVRTAQETLYNLSLKVGQVSEVVTVEAQGAGIDLNKSAPTIGLTSSGRQAVELPLNGDRDVNALALLSPNVFIAPGSSGISSNGQRARNNNFMIDGSDNNDISVTISTSAVIPEAVQEYQVQTNAFSVEFGRNSGAQTNIITKSGNNQYHGDIFEYYQGSAISALSPTEKRNGFDRPARFNRNQFGGVIGGPILKEKLFFFGGLQADRTRTGAQPGPVTVTLPTQAGFAALNSVPLRAASVLPNGTVVPAQSQASRQAALSGLGFLNGIYQLNPVFTNVRNICVNGTGAACTGGQLVQVGATNISISQPENFWNMIGKVDWKISETDSFTGRYLFDKPFSFNFASNAQFGSLYAGNQDIFDQNAAISETHIFTPTLINEVRFSYVRRNLQFPENDPNSPTAGITGFFTIGGLSNFPQGRIQNSYQLSDLLSWQKGRQSLKFGLDIRQIRLSNVSAFDSKGTFTFNGLQAYLNNFAISYTQALQTSSFDARQNQVFVFAQDDYRITPNLTLNLGLRYERSGVPFGFFGATDSQSLGALVPGPVRKDKNNFGPGIGFAYSPRFNGGLLNTLFGDGKTAIRGGYRITYDVLFYNILVVNASNFPRVVAPINNNQFDVYPTRLPVSGQAVFNPLATFVNTPVDAQNPMGQNFSLTIQRQFLNDYVVEFGYAGSRGSYGINQLQANPAILTPDQIATVRSTGDPASIDNAQLRRVLPQFGSRVLIATTAQSTYHSGFVSLTKRLTNGLQLTSAYTFSKNISDNDESLGVADITAGSPQVPQDFFNIQPEKGLSAFDRTHRIVLSGIYEIPWFKAGLANNAVVKSMFSGWQLNGTFSAQSGQPFTILTGVDTNGNGAGGDRPFFNPNGTFAVDPVTGDLRSFTNPILTGSYFLPYVGADGLPVANSIGNGNLGRNTLRGPGFSKFDMGLIKRIKILETKEISLRADAFNIFNQKNFGNPVGNMSSPQFGTNVSQLDFNLQNRALMLGAKFSF